MRKTFLPLALAGLISGGLLAGAAQAQTSLVIRPDGYVGPGMWGTRIVHSDSEVVASLRDQYESAKALHDARDDAWDAIKDACEGDDDATLTVDAQTCRETKALDDAAEDAYENARNDYFAVRSPVVYDPFWGDTYAWHYPGLR